MSQPGADVGMEARVKEADDDEGAVKNTNSPPLQQLQYGEDVQVGGSVSNFEVAAGTRPTLLSSPCPISRAPKDGVCDSGENEIDKAATGDEVSAALEPPAALQNDLILAKLFQVCPPKTLAALRLVCREWMDLSLHTWRETATLQLEWLYSEDGIRVNRKTELNDFMEYVENPLNSCESKCFRKLKLAWVTFGFGETSSELPARFWPYIGSNLSSLDLFRCRFHNVQDFWDIAYVMCPNLIRLALRYCSFCLLDPDPTGEAHQNPYQVPVVGGHRTLKSLVVSHTDLAMSWMELLSHFVSLEYLQVKYWHGQRIEADCEKLASSIIVIRRHDDSLLPLKLLDNRSFAITDKIESHTKFHTLRELKIGLQSVYVDASDGVDVEGVSDILEAHSQTLETLELDIDSSFSMESRFQCRVELKKLTKLIIRGLFLESIIILQSATNLQKVNICYDRSEAGRVDVIFDALEVWQADNPGITLLPRVRRFVYNSGCSIGTNNIRILAKLIPNVQDLALFLNDDEFTTVCELWRGLESLTVTADSEVESKHLTDESLVGGSLQIEATGIRRPNITDLKELTSFSCRSNMLTDISVYNGFLKLPKLQSIILYETVVSNDEDDDSEVDDGNEDDYDPPKYDMQRKFFSDEAMSALKEHGTSLSVY